MIELGAITTALASVKTDSEILKYIRDAGQEFKTIEFLVNGGNNNLS